MKTLATLLAALSVSLFALGCNEEGGDTPAENKAEKALEEAREAKETATDAENKAEKALEEVKEPEGGQ